MTTRQIPRRPEADGAFEAYRAERSGRGRGSAPARGSTTGDPRQAKNGRTSRTAPPARSASARTSAGQVPSARRATQATARRPAQARSSRSGPRPRPPALLRPPRPRTLAPPLPAKASHHRLVGVLVVFTLMFGAVVVKLADIQVLNPDRYVSRGERQRIKSQVIPAGRGSLVDRNGVELALSLPQRTVFADPKMVADAGGIATTASTLARILDLPRAEVLDKISGDGRFVILAHTVPDRVAEQIQKAALPGIATFDEFKRYQPSGEVAGSLLGRVSVDGTQGYSGLERQFDTLLTGKAGRITYERRGSASGTSEGGKTIAGGRQRVVPARPGSNVRLTIDRAMQYETEKVLSEHVAAAGAKGGIAIVTKPRTGEILSMANVTATTEPGGPTKVEPTSNNLAVTTVFEPGSVTKVVTIAAAMDAGLVTPTTPIVVPYQLQVADHAFTDHDPHPTATWSPTDILVTSSNIGTIKIAQSLGKERLDAALRRFGLGTDTGLGFPNESRGLMLDPADWSGTSIGAIPIGQGISVTALQMLGAFNVLANDGVFVGPKLVAGTTDTNGVEHQAAPSKRHRVVSADTATKLRSMMAKVVSEQTGTGTKAAVPGYTVAGKTGTARKPLVEHMPGNGYQDLQGRYHYVATFAGFVPAEHPELSIIVVLDEPTSSIYAGDVSAPAFSELARYALRHEQIPPAVVGGRPTDVPEVSQSAQEISDARVPAGAGTSSTTTGPSGDGTGSPTSTPTSTP